MVRELPGGYYKLFVMYLSAELIPYPLAVATWCLLLSICAACLRLAPWAALRAVPMRQHLVGIGAAACLLLWMLSVTTFDGLWLHFLGVTSLTLVLGLPLALLAGAAASAAHGLLLEGTLHAVAVSWLVTVALPASVSRAVVWWCRHRTSRNLFWYLLGAAFGGGILAMAVAVGAALALFYLIGLEDWWRGALHNWPLLALITFPEGFMNGTVIATATMLHPGALKTFDDDHYLGPPP